MRLISARMSMRSFASRFDSGSSRSSTSGRNAIARASATRCCCPPESWFGVRDAYSTMRTRARHSFTRRAMSALGILRTSRPKATFCATVMCGHSA